MRGKPARAMIRDTVHGGKPVRAATWSRPIRSYFRTAITSVVVASEVRLAMRREHRERSWRPASPSARRSASQFRAITCGFLTRLFAKRTRMSTAALTLSARGFVFLECVRLVKILARLVMTTHPFKSACERLEGPPVAFFDCGGGHFVSFSDPTRLKQKVCVLAASQRRTGCNRSFEVGLSFMFVALAGF
jgi:hypothetical protein